MRPVFCRRYLPAALFLLVACNSKPEASGSGSSEKSVAATPNATATAAPNDASATALRALEEWVAAQNQNKVDAYLGMYDAASFQGVKRTTSGTEQKLDFKAWKDERTRMFGTDVKVAAEGPQVTTVRENPAMGQELVEVRFTQRWKNPRYADHGPKVLRFNLTNGAARIVYEELVSSAPGWEDGPAPAMGGKFVRVRPEHVDRTGIDACAYLGGFGFGCLEALIAEKNPVIKKYMRRLSDADARQAFDQYQAKQPNGVPHAEFADQCADTGPCGGTAGKSDDGYSCLTRAESAIQGNNVAESNAAHERACRCGAERAQIPIMGGFLACQGKTPEKRGQSITSAEALEIRACGECDPQSGPAACAKEIERLSKSDEELAKYITSVHVPRCTKP